MDDTATTGYVDKEIKLAVGFGVTKYGDTPTDNQQLTPKGYVDTQVSSIISKVNSIIGTLSTVQPIQMASVFTAGETLSSMAAVVMGTLSQTSVATSSIEGTIVRNLTTDAIPSGNSLWGQTYVAQKDYLRRVVLPTRVGGGGSWTYTLSVQTTSANLPTNVEIGNTTYSFSAGSPSGINADFVFTTPIKWNPGTVYAFVVNTDTTSNTPAWFYANSSIVPGQQVQKSGGTWSAPDSGNDDFGYVVYESPTLASQVFNTSAVSNDQRANAFLGISTSGGSVTGATQVVFDGIVTGFSGLTTGATYFLSDNRGEIASVAGSQPRKIGLAVSSVALLLKQDNA